MPFKPVLKPYAHQDKAHRKSEGKRAFAYLMGMRTGKTKVTIDEWGKLIYAGEVRDLFVQAPAGAYLTWLTEIEKHVPPDIRESLLIGVWESGGGKAQKEQLRRVIASTDPRRPRVMLVNVEALGVVQEARDASFYFLNQRKAVHAVDESTTIKNPETTWSRNTIALGGLSPYRRILSGLPTPRSPIDIHAQFAFLDPQILRRDFEAFEAHHTIKRNMKVGNRYVKIVVEYKNVEEINPLIEPHSYRVRLEDCADVPKKLYLFRDVELTPQQRKAYDEMKKFAFTKLENGAYVNANEVVTRMLRLHQICCGHVVDEEKNVHELPTNRPKELGNLLEEYDGKAVVWCSYDHDIRRVSDYLRKRFGQKSVARFWGGNRSEREEDDRRFKEDPACRYMVATPAAGGRGRTWSVAGLVVFYSNTDNLEHRDQGEERASAVTKTDRVSVVDMRTPGTVETRIIEAIRKKMNLAATVTGDNWREWLI